MEKPLISILMTLYNHEKFVGAAINSVLSQTYENWELLIMNDFSTDKSEDVVKNFKDKRIKYFKAKQNQGTIISLNSLIKKAKGEYVAILDSDDMWTFDKLEKQLKFMQKYSKYGATFTQADIVDENGKLYPKNKCADIGENVYMQDDMSREDIIRKFYYLGNCLAHPSLMLKKDIFKEVGMHDIRFRQLHDMEFYSRLFLKYDTCIIQEPLLKVRRLSKNNESVSASTMENAVRARNETTMLIYNMIRDMPKDLFISTFKDKIKYEIIDNEDLICEKYFLLRSWLLFGVENLFPAMKYISEYIENKKVLNKLQNKYNFTINDYYELTSQAIQPYEIIYYPEISEELQRIYKSLSWKITKPLRFTKKIFIKIFK